jgi:hypothetical protein
VSWIITYTTKNAPLISKDNEVSIMSSLIDRIFGWFSGSRKEEESVTEEEHMTAQDMEKASGVRDEVNVYGPSDEPVGEKVLATDIDYDEEVYNDYAQPEKQVNESEHAPAFRHEDYFPSVQEQDEPREIPLTISSWLREKKEES